MGMGTGLNALLTLDAAMSHQQKIHYTAIEPYPLEESHWTVLNYCRQLERNDLQPAFDQLHSSPWNIDCVIHENFIIKKLDVDLPGLMTETKFHLIYFDAFAPAAQPELWTIDVFQQLFSLMETGGTLVTYCSKSAVRKAMQESGFLVEKIPGPAGKREMIRAMNPA